jgi:hypothetical protein
VEGVASNRDPYSNRAAGPYRTGSKDVWSNHSRPENKGLGAATGPLLHCTAFMKFRGRQALNDNFRVIRLVTTRFGKKLQASDSLRVVHILPRTSSSIQTTPFLARVTCVSFSRNETPRLVYPEDRSKPSLGDEAR